MKKILSIVLCAAAVSVFGDTTEAVLGGEIGVTTISNSFKNTIVAVSYNDLDPSVASGIAVSNFVKTANLDADDQLAIFNGTGTYDTWVLKENEGVKYWDRNEKTYTVGTDGALTVGEGNAASDITQVVGTGIWLIRKNPTENDNAKPFYIYGKPATSMISTTTADTWTLIGNPTQSEIAIGKDMVKGASEGDQIVVPVAPNGNLCYYMFHSTEGWQRTSIGEDGKPVHKKDLKLGAGLGCWIKTQGAAQITWSSN